MMKKRILISILNLLFLVSTTGLPVTISLCKMADAKDVDQCMMHNKPVKSMCCAEETSENILTISSKLPNCCQISFVYNKVEDQFVSNKTENNFYSSFEKLFVPITLIPNQLELSFGESFYTDSSPPFLINPEIHITNSSLLI
jgi:hypothetical protein